jgi:hypothetical protein
MFDWHTFGVISIILNIILVLLLFFRSALNDILKEWWIDRKKKKEAAIRRLIDFKTNFNDLQIQYFLVIITLAQKQVGLIMDRAVAPFIEDMYQSSLDKVSKAGSQIAEFLDFLPVDLRGCYSRYNEQFTEIIKKIMQGHVAKEDVKEYSEKMKSLALECTNRTDLIIRKNLN